MTFTLRLAEPSDTAELKALMERAIRKLLEPFLPPEAVEASFEIMGLDTQLIADGTYFVVEDGTTVTGCGGWSGRATLFGGDHSSGRDAKWLNPAKDAARIRAMYTDPAHARRGVGRKVLDACEAAALAKGFSRVQLAATLSGEPLYRACGYIAVERFIAPTSAGIDIPLVRMEKALGA
ncbi:MAG: GNAT family N-acetyltransferase [Alphaproteobacteria bacterium]|nr:GNAT family N-acetyltransferase [Alphaproteobacteria bacterium]